jgi:cellobiose phosphorylase
MKEKLWKFSDNVGSFESGAADKIKTLYFPLANEKIMSAVTPDLHGDIKSGQNSFLLEPVSRLDLVDSKSSRNFWIYIDRDNIWSATGVSKNLKQIQTDRFKLNAGLLWHQVQRENQCIGLKLEILSFVPATNEPVEIMRLKITNISCQRIKFIPTTAVPIYARSANNLRDHRHVTSLLERITIHKFGVIVRPTLTFDESGHKPNKTIYFVLGWDEKFNPPRYIYPTQEMFCGEGGDLEAPASILNNLLPSKSQIQGREVMGGLRFASASLAPGKSKSYIMLMGIVNAKSEIQKIINKFNSLHKVDASLIKTKDFWVSLSQKINLSTADSNFDNWFRWVSIQPILRKFFGCSFLPDFDYGKGGRGWRDLWQDCLGLILSGSTQVRTSLINNFSGVRIDGSCATIIGKEKGKFLSDRNNISRVWMDHGVWPLLSLNLYLNETGDYGILFEKTAYFRDHQINRSRAIDYKWNPSLGNKLKTQAGKIYQGTLLEHLLVENLVQFFNVGSHNHIRLEGADWNDGLDMAGARGESVAFSSMYAHNLKLLAQILLKTGKQKIEIAKELKILLATVNYDSINEKLRVLNEYFHKTKSAVSGNKISVATTTLANDLTLKSNWIMEHIRKTEWLKEGFFNGYYNNSCKRVEGKRGSLVRMILASQVFPIMSGIASDWQVEQILKSATKHLFDKRLKGFHLNTDFKQEQHNLGRAFSFVYGDKENGAFFNHMIILFSYSLYIRGFVKQGWQVLSSIYNMALNTDKSKIYPCLPEYFNLEGRGLYLYLTGSASWFALTILTECFGIKGKDGSLLIEPKLMAEQFELKTTISINRSFAGKNLCINFSNPKKLAYPKYRIIQASLNYQNLALKESQQLLISRKTILKLAQGKLNMLNILLG